MARSEHSTSPLLITVMILSVVFTVIACVLMVNSVPRFARASICGVTTSGCPPRHPTQSFRSSMQIMRTFNAPPSSGFAAEDDIMLCGRKSVARQRITVRFIPKV